MTYNDVVRSWRDPQFRASLSPDDRARLADSPAGIVEVPDGDLVSLAGGDDPVCWTYPEWPSVCCPVQ